MKFIQHSYIMHSNENDGYYFKNDQLAITEINYEKGFNLNKIEINNLYKKINYTVPKLVGDGYWSFTFLLQALMNLQVILIIIWMNKFYMKI